MHSPHLLQQIATTATNRSEWLTRAMATYSNLYKVRKYRQQTSVSSLDTPLGEISFCLHHVMHLVTMKFTLQT